MNEPFMDGSERELTETTRRNIADELALLNMMPNGRLNEVEFFGRLFNLQELPTRDTAPTNSPIWRPISGSTG